MTNQELLDRVGGLVERVPVDDVAARHGDELEALAQRRRIFLQLLFEHEAEPLGVDEQRGTPASAVGGGGSRQSSLYIVATAARA